MSRLAVVLVALLVVFAGCGSFSDGSDEPDREPYDVEERVNVSTEEGEELLPGLTTAGLTDPEVLRETHLEAVGNRSHTVRATTEYVVRDGNNTTREIAERTISIDPGAGVVLETIKRSADGNGSDSDLSFEENRTEERWFGDRTLFRTEYEDGTVDYLASEEVEMAIEERMVRASQPLFGLLGGTDSREIPTAGTVEAEDGTYYVVERHENTPAEGGTESTDVRTLVREDGLVRQTVFARVSIEDEGRTTVNRTVEIDDVGETTVERPDWYDEALEANSKEATDGNESGG